MFGISVRYQPYCDQLNAHLHTFGTVPVQNHSDFRTEQQQKSQNNHSYNDFQYSLLAWACFPYTSTYMTLRFDGSTIESKPLPLYADHSSDFRTMPSYADHFRGGSISRPLSNLATTRHYISWILTTQPQGRCDGLSFLYRD